MNQLIVFALKMVNFQTQKGEFWHKK